MCGSSSGRVGVWWASASLAQANHGAQDAAAEARLQTHLQQAANAMRASAFAAFAGSGDACEQRAAHGDYKGARSVFHDM